MLKLILCRVSNILDLIFRTSQVHDFSMVHIAQTIYVVHDIQKLIQIGVLGSFFVNYTTNHERLSNRSKHQASHTLLQQKKIQSF